MLDTLGIFVEGDDIGDGLFVTLIVTQNELQFDTHPGASPSSSDRRIAQPILPEFEGYPQHLPALSVLCQTGLPLRHERFAVGPGRDREWFLGALHRSRRKGHIIPCRR